jgi:cytochrome c oxidase subunit IV
MLLSCVVLSYVYDFIFSQGLFRACVVFDFMPNQNGFFLSYLMLVPVLSIQYTFLSAASFLAAVLYVGASVCGS